MCTWGEEDSGSLEKQGTPKGCAPLTGNSVCKGLRKRVLPAVKKQLAGTMHLPALPVCEWMRGHSNGPCLCSTIVLKDIYHHLMTS